MSIHSCRYTVNVVCWSGMRWIPVLSSIGILNMGHSALGAARSRSIRACPPSERNMFFHYELKMSGQSNIFHVTMTWSLGLFGGLQCACAVCQQWFHGLWVRKMNMTCFKMHRTFICSCTKRSTLGCLVSAVWLTLMSSISRSGVAWTSTDKYVGPYRFPRPDT